MLLVPSSPATLLLPPAPALQPRARVFLPGLQHSPFLKAGPQRGGLPWPPSAGFLLERLRRHPTPAGVRPVWPGALIYDFLVSPQAPGATKAGNPAAGEGFGTLVPRKCVEQANMYVNLGFYSRWPPSPGHYGGSCVAVSASA